MLPLTRRPAGCPDPAARLHVRRDDAGYPKGSEVFSSSQAQPNSVTLVEGRGLFWADPDGAIRYVETCYGGKNRPNPELMKPAPSAQYIVKPSAAQRLRGVQFSHQFFTDHRGRPEYVFAPNVVVPGTRGQGVRYSVNHLPGWGSGLHRGHLLSTELGAGMERINVVPMPSVVNAGYSIETAARRGFQNIVENRKSVAGGLSRRGTLYSSNYREVELVLKMIAYSYPRQVSFHVSLALFEDPDTRRERASILYATIEFRGKQWQYEVENDID